MDFIKRAGLYLRQKIGRTALITLVMSAIMIFVLAGIIIQSAAIQATNSAKNSAGTTVTLSADREKAFASMRKSQSSSSSSSTSTGAGFGGGGGSAPSGAGRSGQTSMTASGSQVSNLKTKISAKSMAELGGLGLEIIAIAVVAGSTPIFRLKPKKILSNE